MLKLMDLYAKIVKFVFFCKKKTIGIYLGRYLELCSAILYLIAISKIMLVKFILVAIKKLTNLKFCNV